MRPTLSIVTLALLFALPGLARAQIATCDALAADPTDPDRPKGVPGVLGDKIDADRAINACEAALAAAPSVVRFKGQLVRALIRRDRDADRDRINRLFDESANEGYRPTQTGLGEALFDSDPEAAMGWFQKAAAKGSALAMDYYGRELERLGKSKDAAVWYRKSADAGFGDGMRDLAIAYAEKRDWASAYAWNTKAATIGNAYAMTGLGQAYESGNGIAADPIKAARWYRGGAEGGDPVAMTAFGRMLAAGTGVARDETAANAWYRKAADHGDPDGMMLLAVNLDKGVGAPRDPAASLALLRKVAGAGQDESPTAMGLIGFAYLAGDGVAKNQAEGLAWLRRAAKAGNTSASAFLAKFESKGAADK